MNEWLSKQTPNCEPRTTLDGDTDHLEKQPQLYSCLVILCCTYYIISSVSDCRTALDKVMNTV